MKKTKAIALTPEETRLMEQLRQHPEIKERLRSILEIAGSEGGADEDGRSGGEELLVEEMRRLGHVTMTQWATQAEERLSTELKRQDPTARSRKKNADVVVCLWTGGGEGEDLVQSHPALPASVSAGLGRHAARTVATAGAGPDRLWL